MKKQQDPEEPQNGRRAKKNSQQTWLEAFRDSGDENHALIVADISPRTLYRWKEEPDFQLRYYEMKGPAGENLEKGALRILQWCLRPENYARTMQYPTLLLRALERFRPEQWGRRMNLGIEQAQDVVSKLMSMSGQPTVEGETGAAKKLDGPALSSQVTKFLEDLDGPNTTSAG